MKLAFSKRFIKDYRRLPVSIQKEADKQLERYVLAPPSDQKSARPYDLEILQRSFDIQPHGQVPDSGYCSERGLDLKKANAAQADLNFI